MANIMQMFKAKNKVSRGGYDLSKKLAFTAKTGELLPVYSRLCMPNDYFDIETKFMTNTRPLNSDAYTSIREYYDWYFVPLNLLWDKYNTWFTAMTDNEQVATSINSKTKLTDKHPYFTTRQIKTLLNSMELLAENNNKTNAFGFERHLQSKKLLSYLGYGDFYDADDVLLPEGETMPKDAQINAELSPWRLLAYQKICDDFYRFDQWTAARPYCWNINYIDGSESSLNIPLSEIDVSKLNMFDLHYANWNKDLFMGLLPNSQYGDAASVDLSTLFDSPTAYDMQMQTSLNSTANAGPLTGTATSSTPANVQQNGVNVKLHFTPSMLNSLKNSLGLTNTNLQSAFTILALRQAEAAQKMKEIMGSNPKDFPNQIEARYGTKPSSAYGQTCQWIKGIDATLDINPVINNNLADGNAASTSGRGTSAGSGKFTFETDVPGILMCIYHNQPRLDYATTGVDLQNLKTFFTDYAQPEFDKTGMQQVPMIALANRFDGSWATAGVKLLGYAPIYIDYKTDIDEIKGGFVYGGLGAWVAPIGNRYLHNWLTRNGAMDGNYFPVWDGLDQWFFKINPSVLDPIFSGEEVDSYLSSDQFWINAYFDIRASRPLDPQGLPY